MTLLPHYPHKPSHLIPKLKIALRGQTLLNSPRFNKGTAFSPRERKALGLTGRIPYHINTLEQQVARAYDQLSTRDTPIRKNTFLASLKDQNWVLYYSLVGKHLRELVPVIYTPTQGDAIANYSHLYRKPEGLFLTYASQHTMEEAFDEATRGREIDLVVVTDSEAILGIGDQGVGGIGISTAKAAMYTLIGGIDPSRCLPVVLDVGTDNKALLEDPLYVGWVHERVRGEGYDAFVDKFVQLVRKKYPNSLLHFEDFGTNNAYRLLHKYKNSHAAFNDDIQGTGAVTLACLLAAISISSHTSHTTPSVQSPQPNRLSAQRIVIFGAGSAGMGIAVQVRDAMLTADGVSRSTANRCFYLVDKDGLLYEGGPSSSSSSSSTSPSATIENPEWLKARTEFVRPSSEGWSGHISLSDLVNAVKPTILIGCSTVPGAFTEEIIRSMASGLVNGEKPIVMPLSNPSRLVEAKPEDIMHWTDGRALVATGSPFPDVRMEVEGEERVFQIAECNNALIYPGLGFGAILAKSSRMTDTMLLAGAQKLARLSPAVQSLSPAASSPFSPHSILSSISPNSSDRSKSRKYTGASILPNFSTAPQTNFLIAVAVAQQAVIEGSARASWASATPDESGDSNVGDNSAKGGYGEETARGAVKDMILSQVKEEAERRVWVPVYPEYEYDEDGLRD